MSIFMHFVRATVILVLIVNNICDGNTVTQNNISVTQPNSVNLFNANKICDVDWSENIIKQWKKRKRLQIRKQRSVESTSLKHLGNKDIPSIENITDIERFKREWPVDLWRQYLFEDDYLLLINPHWLKFPPPSETINIILGSGYIGMFLVGCTGNALVLILYSRCRSLRTPGNILVANLALSDLIMILKTPMFIFNSFHSGPALGKTACNLYGFIGGLSGTTSIATLAAIALDRYWAILRPLEPLRSLTKVRARALAIGSWLYAGIFASIPAFDIGYGRYVPEGYLTSCSFDYLTEELKPKYFIFAFFCAAWVAPFLTITFCYLRILKMAFQTTHVSLKNKAPMADNTMSRHFKEHSKRKAEIKLAVLVIIVIALFFLSWTPYAVVTLLGIFGGKDLITPTLSIVPALFCKTAACVNPFVYIISHPKFRKEFTRLFILKRKKTSLYRSSMYTEAPALKYNDSETDLEILKIEDIPYKHKENNKDIAIRPTIDTVSFYVGEKEKEKSNILNSDSPILRKSLKNTNFVSFE